MSYDDAIGDAYRLAEMTETTPSEAQRQRDFLAAQQARWAAEDAANRARTHRS